jgi:hypothetical protein
MTIGRRGRTRPIRQTTTPVPAKGWRLAALLLLGAGRGESSGVDHVVPGGRDPAVGALDVGDAELVDVAVEGIGDTADVPADAEGG